VNLEVRISLRRRLVLCSNKSDWRQMYVRVGST